MSVCSRVVADAFPLMLVVEGVWTSTVTRVYGLGTVCSIQPIILFGLKGLRDPKSLAAGLVAAALICTQILSPF